MSPAPSAAPRLLLALAGVLSAVPPVDGLETDQYLAWSVRLEDSQRAVDRYLEAELDRVLARVDRAPISVSCPEITVRFFRRLAPTLIYSRIRRRLGSDPAIDRFPERDVGYLEYLRRSIYRRPTWPFVLPMSRVLRIGDVYVGADKLGGHLFGFGRRYYLRYLRLRDRGLDEEAAVRRVIEWGFDVERTVVGGLADGVFSPADLEANYSGLLMARSFCEGEQPLLERRRGHWRATRRIDIGRWVTPYFDETFNPNFYVGYRWRKVREPLARYCQVYRRPPMHRRFESYSRRASPSRAQDLLAERLARSSAALFRHSIHALCPPADLRLLARAARVSSSQVPSRELNEAGSGTRP